jgi:hypothetical protein
LAFPAALTLFQQAAQPLDFGVATFNRGLKPDQPLLHHQAIRACGPHTRSLARYRFVSCASFT